VKQLGRPASEARQRSETVATDRRTPRPRSGRRVGSAPTVLVLWTTPLNVLGHAQGGTEHPRPAPGVNFRKIADDSLSIVPEEELR
jgi:hypothetical protein